MAAFQTDFADQRRSIAPMTDSPATIAKRCVVFFGGYEHVPAERQFTRMARELERFGKTWNVRTQVSDPTILHGGSVQIWPIATEGPNWRVETNLNYCAWNDLIDEDFSRPDWRSIPTGLLALVDFVFTLTAFRYLAAAWRYWLFAIYPFVLSVLFGAIAVLAARAPGWIGLALPWYFAIPFAILVFWLLVRWPGDRLRLRYMLNDWSFASAIARGRRKSYSDRIDDFARFLADEVRRTDADEILIVGHSLGAVLAIEALSAALRRHPDLATSGPSVTLMTVGSSLLKVALHPSAHGVREAVGRVLAATDIAWIDYSALVDPLNFYRCDPGKALNLNAPRSPLIRTVRIRSMLGEASYRLFKGDFLRLHRQFVMGNGQRYHYDFFMACCGPMPQEGRIANMALSVDNFAEDGSYRPVDQESEPPVAAEAGR